MLICKSRKLKRKSDLGCVTFVHMKRKRWGASCCWNELKEWFDVPKDAKEIQIAVHTSPANSRYRVTLKRKFEHAVDMTVYGPSCTLGIGELSRTAAQGLHSQDEELERLGKLVDTQSESIARLHEERHKAEAISRDSINITKGQRKEIDRLKKLMQIRDQQIEIMEDEARKLAKHWRERDARVQSYRTAARVLGVTLAASLVLIVVLVAAL